MALAMRLTHIRPDSVPGYRITHAIGKGATGEVFHAVAEDTGRSAAIKILYPERARDADRPVRLRRERELAARIDHPNVVRCLGGGEIEGSPYLVFEFVAGDTLSHLIRRAGRIEERRAAAWMLDVARALEAARGVGVIHRDIKPANILIDDGGAARVMDFGLARGQDDATVTIQGTILGTPSYVSPEQVRCEPDLDSRTDLYSLGATFFHAVAGAPPFAELSLSLLLTKKVIEEIPDPRTVCKDLSADAARIIMKLARRDRDQRYATPAEAAADLEKLLSGRAMAIAAPQDTEDTMSGEPDAEPAPPAPVSHPVLVAAMSHPEAPPRSIKLPAGKVLFYEDEAGRDAYIVISGQLEVLKAGRRIGLISAEGALVGEMSCLLGSRRTATLRAVAATRLLRIPGDDLKRFLGQADLAHHVATSLARRLAVTSERLKEAQTALASIREQCAVIEGDVEMA